jgi:hypothetical protein
MLRTLPLALFLACGACLAAAGHPAEEASQEATFDLTAIAAKDAATLVRTIAAIRTLRIPDDNTLVVEGTADDLALVTALLQMAETPGDASGANRLAVSDGSVVVGLVLEHATPADVMRALRTEVKIARVTASESGRMFLRDTEPQIEAALALVQRMEGAGKD